MKKHNRDRLERLVSERSVKSSATELYQWVLANYEDILSIRSSGDPWAPYVVAAKEDGIIFPDEARATRHMERCWSRVSQRMRRLVHRKTVDVVDQADVADPEAPVYPSQTSPDWKPAVSGDSDLGEKKTASVADVASTIGSTPDVEISKDAPSPAAQDRINQILAKVRRAQIDQSGGMMEG